MGFTFLSKRPTRKTPQFWSSLSPKKRLTAALFLLILGISIPGTTLITANQPIDWMGGEPNAERLINNHLITPAGFETKLGDLPFNAVQSPDFHHILVINSGAGVQSIQVVETANSKVIQTIPYVAPDSVFIGAAYSPDGTTAYVSGGGADVIHVYGVDPTGILYRKQDIPDGTLKSNPFPTGLSISADGNTLYVANNLSSSVAIIDTKAMTVTSTVAVGSYPYGTVVSPDGKSVYVSNWGDATVSVIDVASQKVTSTIPVGNHPSTMTFGAHNLLFVANSNSDNVSAIDTTTNSEANRISVAPYSGAPLSSSPEGLAASTDGKFLYVANSGEDAVDIFSLNGSAATLTGRVPTAWYPTSVVLSSDNHTMYVTNGKGHGAGPNSPNGIGFSPNPASKKVPILDAVDGYADGYCNCTDDKYSGSMMNGTMQTIWIPSGEKLKSYTSQVASNNQEANVYTARTPGNPIPLDGGKSPIKHVIYIIKENRTYDQVFGDMPVGDGDSSLTLFPRANTPNLHSLLDRFGVIDNFYADAEVSADGHNWAMSANASDYNQKTWPQDYSPGDGRNRGYDYEGSSAINMSPGGYLWDTAAASNITYRDYGEYIQFDANYPASKGKFISEVNAADNCDGPIARTYFNKVIPAGQVLCFLPMAVNPATTPKLVGHFDPKFRTYDNNYNESERVTEWKREFDQFVAGDNLPQLEIVRLPKDHTSGTQPGKQTPQSAVAENDAGVGQLVDFVSHSKYWASTAIFVTEDDAQNGADHVDAHRTTSLVISPYTSHSYTRVEHSLYDTASMIRTMELILGLAPLSQFDANARPMWHMFTPYPNTAPYNMLPEDATILNSKNTTSSYGALESSKMNFDEADKMPMDQLNDIIWHSVKGDVPYPNLHGDKATTTNPDGDGK